MRSGSPLIVGDIERYKQSGEHRPSAAKLNSSLSKLEQTGEVARMLIAADMCIDLAFADIPGNEESSIGRASDLLQDLIEQMQYHNQSDNDKTYQRGISFAAAAHIKLTELDNWLSAAKGGELQNTYEAELAATERIVLDYPNSHDRLRSVLVENIPVLLGMRAQYRKIGGWFGRLALAREESRPVLSQGLNPNWDTGICMDAMPDLDKPDKRLQLKSGKNSKAKTYAQKGIIPMSAKSHGFGNPFPVAFGCLVEAGIINANDVGDSITPKTTAELDDITERVQATCLQPL